MLFFHRNGRSQIRDDHFPKDKIEKQGPPIAVIVTDKEYEEEVRIWKIEGGATVISFRKGRANVNSIIQHTDEYIDALIKCRESS